MADSSSKHTVVVNTEGLDVAVKSSKELNINLASAAKSGAQIRTPIALQAARAGLNQQGQAAADSNTARGLGGLTGASARDFASQAQGLGGLVHVYATFAANIFAISSAFTALSKAADTTNLVKGLDQLGAAAGRNLGSVAKELVKVTGGALSMRDALEATANASAGGLSNTNILRLGNVARQAAQALGRDMPDAVNRLTRGITKLEPELLDELGIMVRIDTVTRDYAKSIGKAAISLTDFEKRQAFANAVLTQGEQKFGAIQLDTNPYAKVLASIQNLTQAGLELFNKVLGPIANLLSQSPTALAATLAGITALLLKQAIPAISNWRQKLVDAATAANDLVIKTNQLRRSAIGDKDHEKVAEAIAANNRLVESFGRLNDAKKTRTTAGILAGQQQAENLSLAQIEALEKRSAALKKIDVQGNIVKAMQYNEESRHLDAVTKAYREHIALAGQIANIEKEVDKSLLGRLKTYFSIDEANNRIANRAAQKATQANILSDVAKNLPVAGVADSFRLLTDQIAKARKGQDGLGQAFTDGRAPLTRFGAAVTGVKGTLSIATQSLTTMVSSLGNVFAAIGIAVAAFQILDSIFSNTAKESANFSEAIDNLESSVDNVNRTLDVLAKKDLAMQVSIDSTKARANALQELSDAANRASDSYGKLLAAANYWDGLVDSVKDLFGQGVADKAATSLSKSIVKALEVAQEGPAKDAAQKAFKELLNVDPTNFSSVEKMLRGLNYKQLEDTARGIGSVLQTLSHELSNQASALATFQEALKETSKQASTMNASLKPTDDFSKLGTQLIDLAQSYNKALKQPIDAFKALKELAGDVTTVSLLPQSTARELAFAKQELDAIGAALARNKEVAKAAQEAYDKVANGPDRKMLGQVAEAKNALAVANAAVARSEKAVNDIVSRLSNVGADLFGVGIANLTKGLNKAAAEAAIVLGQGYLAIIKQAGGNTAAAEGRLRNEELELQKADIIAKYEQSKQMLLLTDAVEVNNLLMQQEANERKMSRDKDNLAALQQESERITKALQLYADRGVLLKLDNVKVSTLAAKDTTNPLFEAASSLKGYFAELFGKESKLAAVLSKQQLNEVQTQAGVLGENSNDDVSRIKRQQQLNTLDQARISNQETFLGFFDEELNARKLALDLTAQALDYAIKYREAAKDIATAELVRQKIQEKGDNLSLEQKQALASAEDAIAKGRLRQAQADIELRKNTDNIRLANIDKVLKGEKDTADRVAARSKLEIENANALLSITLDRIEAQNAYDSSVGALNETETASAKTQLELARQAIDYNNKLLALDTQRINLKYLEARLNAATVAGITGAPLKELKDQYDSAARSLTAQVAAVNNANAAKVESIRLNGIIGLQLAEQERISKILAETTEALTGLFGQLGTSIGAAVSALTNLAQTNVRFQTQSLKFEEDKAAILSNPNLNSLDQQEELMKLDKRRAEFNKKSAKDELNATIAFTSATKKMFSERTAAYKTLEAVEKGLYTFKFLMMAKELAMEGVMLAKTIASAIAGTTAKGTEAIANQAAKGDPYTAFARMAAMAVAISALLSKLGGGSISPPSGFTSADQQAVQGTGTAYQDGQLVNRGGGALGDPFAKGKSLTEGISMIEEHTFDTLEYSNKMLEALNSIKDNTNGLTTAILRAGINLVGSGLNGDTGTSTGFDGNLLGNLNKLGNDAFFKLLGMGNSGIANWVGKISNSVFGGRTTTSVEDVGIQVSGLLGTIEQSAAGLAQQYVNIKKVTDGGWFRSDRTTFETQVSSLGDDINKYISLTFGSLKDAVLASSEVLGKDPAITKSLIDSFSVAFKFSIKGLKPEEIATALNAELSIQFNKIVELVAPEVKAFQQAGEELGTTLLRLANDVRVTSLALESIGITITGVNSGLENINIAENLIELAGGLSTFVSQADFFKENFLTAAEQLAPVQKRVREELQRLGLASVDTRQEFADVVRGLDLTSANGQTLYAALMNIAEAFAEVYPETRNVLTAEEKRKEQIQQQIEIYRLEGEEAKALFLMRQEELAQMGESLRAGQLYIYALEDEAALKAKIKTAYDKEAAALKSTISAMDSSIKTISDYKASLQIGALSNLSPTEKYNEAKRQAMQVAALATGIATTDAEKAAKLDAINRLPQVASTFLDASRTLFSSGEAYNSDLSSIMGLLDQSSQYLANQKTDAQLQLDVLNSNTDILEIIKDNTGTTAELLNELKIAQQNTAAAAILAAQSGLIVNSGATNTPDISSLIAALTAAFVPTAPSGDPRQTIDPVNTEDGRVTALGFQALTNEIVALRTEVTALRAEQAEQTGAIIESNYDANARNADSINEGLVTSANDEAYRGRTEFRLA